MIAPSSFAFIWRNPISVYGGWRWRSSANSISYITAILVFYHGQGRWIHCAKQTMQEPQTHKFPYLTYKHEHVLSCTITLACWMSHQTNVHQEKRTLLTWVCVVDCEKTAHLQHIKQHVAVTFKVKLVSEMLVWYLLFNTTANTAAIDRHGFCTTEQVCSFCLLFPCQSSACLLQSIKHRHWHATSAMNLCCLFECF